MGFMRRVNGTTGQIAKPRHVGGEIAGGELQMIELHNCFIMIYSTPLDPAIPRKRNSLPELAGFFSESNSSLNTCLPGCRSLATSRHILRYP